MTKINKSIVVIGANQCALAFAYFAARKGFEVSVYEQKSRENVAYDWTDDVAPSAFVDTGLPMPPSEVRCKSHCVAFVSPDKLTEIYVGQDEGEQDYAVMRKPFNAWLEKLAKDTGVKVFYQKKAVSPILCGGRVQGVRFADGDEVSAGLTVDCCGVNSALRQAMPKEYGITGEVKNGDKFYVKRRIYERVKSAPEPKNPKRLYLKHLGETGISWSVLCRGDEAVDVLIGRIGSLDEATCQKALDDLRNENPVIGDRVLSGDNEVLQIPIRHPISKLFCDGYALLGDSACMTIPLIGSGMASGIRAAKMLADAISGGGENPFCSAALYKYQYNFIKEIGVGHSAIEVFKNNLLPADAKDIDALISSGLLANIAASSEDGKGGVFTAACKLIKSNRHLVAMLLRVAAKAAGAALTASSIPQEYDCEKLCKWQNKYEKSFM